MESKEQQSAPAGSQTKQDRVEISTSPIDEAVAEAAIGQENGVGAEDQTVTSDVYL